MKKYKTKFYSFKIFSCNCFQGLAFVDFEDEVAAAAALLKTDGMKLKVSRSFTS